MASWRPLGEVWEASWSALGRLQDQKKVLPNGSWPVQEEFQERFQPSWRPKGSQKGRQKGGKSSSRGDLSSKWRNLEFCRTSYTKSLFLRSRGLPLEGKMATRWLQNGISSSASCRISAQRPLGALLEPSGAEKKYSWTALGRSKRDFIEIHGFSGPQGRRPTGRASGCGSVGFAAFGPFHSVNISILGSEAWVPQ